MSLKLAPCDQYEGIQIEYKRNGKKFCRNKSRFAKDKLLKTPPCDQYEGNYIEYTKDNKQYCRESKSKKNIPNIDVSYSKSLKKDSNLKKKKFIEDKEPNFCLKFSKEELNQICLILNIDQQKNQTEICQILLDIINDDSKESLTGNVYYSTTIDDVEHICHLLNIKLYDSEQKQYKNLEQLFTEICQIITKYSTPQFKKLLSKIVNKEISCDSQSGYVITKIIKNILYPNNFPKESPIPISEQLYEKLLLMKEKKILNDKTQKFLLDQSLHAKICHCVKNLLITDKFKKEVLNQSTEYNPYAICTSSVYKDRNIKVPHREILNCPVDYTWYKKLDYITKQSKVSNKQSKSIDKKNNNLKGGSNGVCASNCGFNTIGHTPVDNCALNHKEVDMMQWPNIFSNTDGWKGSGWP
jgi:hypothetical protein